MIVVSDASPLISLATVQHLDLLYKLYVEVLIPEAVHSEITKIKNAPGAGEIEAAAWIRVQPVQNHEMVTSLSRDVDQGEAAAIALAVEMHADLLLIDERRGRKSAKELKQRVIGLLGVLIEAKQSGHIPAVKPVLKALVTKAGFRVSDALYNRVLEAAGEPE